MSRLATIEIDRGELKFSAGHFMVFSETARENMHGHDYQISVAFHTLIHSNGMCFDVRLYKERLNALCLSLDYRFILPSQSDFLSLEDADDKWIAHTCGQALPFLKTDTVILPICNVTLEELSYWVLQQLLQNPEELKEHSIKGIDLRVHNGRGQVGISSWECTSLPHRQISREQAFSV